MEFGFNQILQKVRQTGISLTTLKNVGEILLRLNTLLSIYKTDTKKYTAAEWSQRAGSLFEEAYGILSGHA